jgi:hypothetical protein
MADMSAPDPASELCRVHEDVIERGFTLTTEWDIGLPPKFGNDFQETFFNVGHLRHDDGDKPDDRERARDVILYEWNDGKLTLEEYETIAIWDRSEIKGERIHKRVKLLDDPQARDLIEIFLSLVPEGRRRQRGTFGVNLFRTHTDVVSKPHQDEEEFIILYVLDRKGDGAESYLYKYDEQKMGAEEVGEQVLCKQLNPGDLMIFEDGRFKHGATRLIPPPGSRAQRDVLICTVDFPTTYLERDPVSLAVRRHARAQPDRPSNTIFCHAKLCVFWWATGPLKQVLQRILLLISMSAVQAITVRVPVLGRASGNGVNNEVLSPAVTKPLVIG